MIGIVALIWTGRNAFQMAHRICIFNSPFCQFCIMPSTCVTCCGFCYCYCCCCCCCRCQLPVASWKLPVASWKGSARYKFVRGVKDKKTKTKNKTSPSIAKLACQLAFVAVSAQLWPQEQKPKLSSCRPSWDWDWDWINIQLHSWRRI